MQSPTTERYGVLEQNSPSSSTAFASESIRNVGYAVVDGGYHPAWLKTLSEAFDRAQHAATNRLGGRDALTELDEHNTIRLLLAYDPIFLSLASNAQVLEICQELISGYVILSQQNGIINPPIGAKYNQAAWHRDLPYQHFTSSRPLAINALFCIEPFTIENGATMVLPASHRAEQFPSDQFLQSQATAISASAGSFIILDCMTYHCGGVNRTSTPRRAVNHLYTIPLFRQQIDIPEVLGDDFCGDQALKKLLGFEVRTPRSIESFFSSRRK